MRYPDISARRPVGRRIICKCRLTSEMPKKKAEPGSLAWNIGANVRRLRKPTGMSQEELAHVCGYHRTYAE